MLEIEKITTILANIVTIIAGLMAIIKWLDNRD